MNESRVKKGGSPIGAITVITAIMVLCLTVFAVLSYSSGSAELRLAEAGAEAVESYYEADTLASEILAGAIAGVSESELRERAPQAEIDFDGKTIEISIPAGERITLVVEAEIEYGRARIVEWRETADTEEWSNA